jgi:hypothetical protein
MPPSMRVIFVRRGQLATYNVLVERCQLIQDVDVRWDRRLGDDRRLQSQPVTLERRREDRRRISEAPDIAMRGYTVVDMTT